MQGVPQKRTVQVPEDFAKEALKSLPRVKPIDHPEHTFVWSKIECEAINRQIAKAVNGLVTLCSDKVKAAEDRFTALHVKWKKQRQEYANLQRTHQTLRHERDALKLENQRLRGIVPETLETLNDEIIVENDELRQQLAARVPDGYRESAIALIDAVRRDWPSTPTHRARALTAADRLARVLQEAAPQPERVVLTDEQDRALCEAHCNEASDEYFKARPQLDSDVNRRVFHAGHRKAWLAKQEVSNAADRQNNTTDGKGA